MQKIDGFSKNVGFSGELPSDKIKLETARARGEILWNYMN